MIRRILLLLIVLGLAAPAGAGEVWDEPGLSADPQALLALAARTEPDTEQGAVLLFREEIYRLDETARVEMRKRLIYRVDSEAAVPAMSLVSMTWRPWHQERPEIRARVVTRDGSVHVLNPDDVGEYSADVGGPELFGDTKVLRGPLPAVAPGAVVEEQYTVRDTAPFFKSGVMTMISLGMPLRAERTRVVVDAPASTPPRYIARLLPALEVETIETDDRVRLVFDQGPLPAHDSIEMFLPDDVAPVPWIGFTTVSDWATVAAGYSAIVAEQLQGANVAKLVNKTLRKVEGRDEKIERLLAAVQERVRYTGVEFGAQAIVPAPPQTTLQRGFGDCKDKATLLVAMLREAGFEARLALLSAGPWLDLDPQLPGLEAFDHAIVHVADDPPVWIDPSFRFARAGELPIPDQGRLALVIDSATSDLIETPRADSSQNRVVQRREVFLAHSGGGRVVETTTWHGAFEQLHREFYSSLTETDIRESLERYVEDQYGQGELGEVELSEVGDLSRPLTLRLEARGVGYAWTAPAEAWVLMPTGPMLQDLPAPFFDTPDEEETTATPRKNDLVLSNPHRHEWHYEVHAPPGYVLRELPETSSYEFAHAVLREEYSVDENGNAQAKMTFDTGRDRFTAEQTREASESIAKFFETDAARVTFDQQGELHLAAGRVGEALAEFRRLAAEYPEVALYRSQIARALIAAGLGEAARAEARRATELEPDSAVAYNALGLALAHDALGRKHHRGFDLAGAEAAFRKAKQLDPEDFEARGELAILLEHDENGHRYSRDARLDEAIAEYQAILDDLDDSGLTGNMLVAMLRSGKIEETKSLAYEHRTTRVGAIALLAAIAISDGADAAIREATRLLDADSRGEYLISTAEELIFARFYRQAAALIAAGSKGAPDALARMAQADLMRRCRRYEELEISTDTPEGLMRQFFVAAFRDGSSGEEVMQLFAERLRAGLGPEDLESFGMAMALFRRMFLRAGLSTEIVLDLVLSLADISAEGEDKTGYRVRIEILEPHTGSSQRQTAYVLREGDQFRLIGFQQATSPVGALILDWIEDGELERARKWLNWIHQDTSSTRGDDPLSLDPFRRLWSPEAEADPARMRYAAASLLVDRQFADLGNEVLRDGLAEAASDELKLDLSVALMRIASLTEDFESLAEVAARVSGIEPDSEIAFAALVGSLLTLERLDELERAAVARLERDADNWPARQALAEIALMRGDAAAWERVVRERIDSGQAIAADFNNLAWFELGQGRVSEKTLELAQRAVVMTNYSGIASLHTLAAVYAELDRPVEAREVLLRVVDTREGGELKESDDWYIFGRIAESYAALDTARDAYGRVTPEETPSSAHVSSYDLAQRRLSSLKQPGQASVESVR